MLLVNCESQEGTEKDADQPAPAPAASISKNTAVEPENNLAKLPDGESRAIRGQKIQN